MMLGSANNQEEEREKDSQRGKEWKDANIEGDYAGVAVYGGEWWCLALVGRGKVTAATDNAGPVDDTQGNAI